MNYRQQFTVLSIAIIVILAGITADHYFFSPSRLALGRDDIDDVNKIVNQVANTSAIVDPKVASSTLAEQHARPQLVVLAFDGSLSLPMWQNTRDFAREMASSAKPVHFTYFINGVYLLAPHDQHLYQAPGMPIGVSNIGFSSSKQDVLQRIDQINTAISEGHEIGSHNAGHFSGDKWSYDEWKGQLSLFNSIVYGANTVDPDYHLNLKQGDVVGFRAPNLAVNHHMYQALHDLGYRYDTSGLGFGKVWPTKDALGLWQFPIPTIWIERNGHRRPVNGMDYSIFVFQTGAKSTAFKGAPAWNELYKQTYDAYMAHFNKNYEGNHAPVFVANHFSTWNDGVYWEVMKDFARQVCGKPEVKCISYKELADYMDKL